MQDMFRLFQDRPQERSRVRTLQEVVQIVNFEIVKKAIDCYESGEVYFVSATDKAARFIASDVMVRVEITPSGTRFQCECEHHKHKQLQDKLCGRIIAVLIYLYHKKGKL